MNAIPGREAVFVFGAGASRDLDVPIMRKFGEALRMLPRACAFDKDVRDDFASVVDWLDDLANQGAPFIDAGNIEDVFCLWQMEEQIGKPDADKKLKSLINVIAYTIEASLLDVPQDSGYSRFFDKLGELYPAADPKGELPYSFVTLNYDLALEVTWWSKFIRDYDKPLARYGLIGRKWNISTFYPLVLKLHGSINWGICLSCGNVQMIAVNPKVGHGSGPRVLDRLRDTRCTWHPESHWELHDPPSDMFYRPLLVPPNLSKAGYCPTLRDIWRQAEQEFSGTRRLVFVGYSLAESDMHFKYLLAAGLAGRSMPSVMVVNLHQCGDQERESKDRFSRTLGVAFDKTDRHRYINRPFSEAVDDIAEFLQRPV